VGQVPSLRLSRFSRARDHYLLPGCSQKNTERAGRVGVGSRGTSTGTKRTIYLSGGRKRSMALEDAFWESLKEVAHRR
jgi:hypothetical protein